MKVPVDLLYFKEKIMDENEQDKWYELGQIVAIEEISNRFIEKSGGFFKVGRDVDAKITRQWGKELAKEAVGRRQKYSSKYHEKADEMPNGQM